MKCLIDVVWFRDSLGLCIIECGYSKKKKLGLKFDIGVMQFWIFVVKEAINMLWDQIVI